MTTRAQIVSEARLWAEAPTPYAHQGRTFGLACDCGGLIGGVAVSLGLLPRDWWATTFDPRLGGYSRQPSNGTLQRVCESFMSAIEPADMGPGDVVLMQFQRQPQHLAILADYRHGGLSVIHALRTIGRVAEHRLSQQWGECIVAAYRMPGVAA